MKRIYIAGAYSADNVIEILDNMRRGMRAATECFLAGNAPFCPWLDFHFQLMLREGEVLTVQDYYEYSTAWLKVADELWVLPDYEYSQGTWREIETAEIIGIPIKYL